MKKIVVALVAIHLSVAAHASSCWVVQSNDVHEFFKLYNDSVYVVVATPRLTKTQADGAKQYLLDIESSWKYSARKELSVKSPSEFARAVIFAPDLSLDRQVFFLKHGESEEVLRGCNHRVLSSREGMLADLETVRAAYVNQGMLGDRPTGGTVCVKPVEWRTNANREPKKYTIEVIGSEILETSDVMSVAIKGLSPKERHLMHIREGGKAKASFYFDAPGEGEQLCLYERVKDWLLGGDNCGCVWDDSVRDGFGIR